MASLSKSQRKALRDATKDGPTPAKQAIVHVAKCLWPYACFICRKSWKRSAETGGKCPECSGELHWMGRAFKVPKKADAEQWAKVGALWNAGFRFPSHERWRDLEPYPERLREVADFIRRNREYPFRVKP